MTFKRIKLNDLECMALDNFEPIYKDSIDHKDFKNKKSDKLTICFDPMFKYMFFNSNKLKYSAKLISLIVDIDYADLLENMSLTKNEYNKRFVYDKSMRGDFIADTKDSKIMIDINNRVTTKNYKNIYERNLGYQNKVFDKENKSGDSYNFNTTVMININNFYYKEIDDWYQVFKIQDDNNILLTKKIIIINIFLPLLLKKCYNEDKEKFSELEKYLLTIYSDNYNYSKKISEGDELMEEYVKDAMDAASDELILESLDLEEEAKYEGETIGLKKGETIGENKAHLEDAKRMLVKGYDINDISDITSLSVEEIKTLEEE